MRFARQVGDIDEARRHLISSPAWRTPYSSIAANAPRSNGYKFSFSDNARSRPHIPR